MVGLCHPLLACHTAGGGRGLVTIALQLHGLVVGAYKEAVMEATLVDEGLVLHTSLLPQGRYMAQGYYAQQADYVS